VNDPTKSATPDAQSTRRYLLGKLAEADRDRLETRLLSDAAAYEQVLAAEEELIDEYVDGELSAADRRAFEERLLTVERIRARVGFARSLRALAAEADAAATAPTRSAGRGVGRGAGRDEGAGWGDRLAALLGLGRLSPSPVFATAMAAAFVLLVGVCGWLGWRAAELAGRVESLQARAAATRSALEHERAARAAAPEVPSAPDAELADAERTAAAAELERERERAERLAERVAELESRPAPDPRVTAAFILSLATRSSSGVREIAVPADADTVRLQLDAGGDAGGSLRARLLAAGGRVAWSDAGLTTVADGSLVVAELPAELLAPGRYELLLEAAPAEGGEPELIGAYEFHVR